ncbi:hypothetical protein Tco_1305486 [Tanacetum coccineum]
MDANKKVDLENPLCPDENRILADFLKNHPLRFNIAASLSVPWIYLGQFWHTLHEDKSKYTLKFMLDRKKLTLTLDDFRIIFQLPQATDNNHDNFVPAPTFSEMVLFYINDLGFTMKLRSTSNFKTTGLLQLWQTLCKMFSRCLKKRVTKLLWEGFYYSFKNPTTMTPYPRFTKLIVSHYMTIFLEISRRARDRYDNLADDVVIKSIFNSGKSKDVPTTQSQPIESTQGTHRTTSAPRTPNPVVAKGESKQKSCEELEATQNVEKVKEHLKAEEIEKLVEGSENVEVNNSPLRNDDDQNVPGTRLEPRSDKERPEVDNIAEISQPVNVTEEEEESLEDDYELRRREKGKHVDEIRNTPFPTTIRSSRIPTNLPSLAVLDVTRFSFKNYKDVMVICLNIFWPSSCHEGSWPKDIMMESLPNLVDERNKKILQTQVLLHVTQGIILEREKSQADMAKMIAEAIQQERVNLHSKISSQVNVAIANHIPLQVATTSCRSSTVRPRDMDDPHDDAHLKGENSAKRQKTSEYRTFEIGGSSFGQDYESEPDNDVIPNEKVSQELVDEISQTIDEAKLHKVVNEM